MKRAWYVALLAILAAVTLASPASAQVNGWAEMSNGWGEMQTVPGFTTIPPPASATPGCVGVFLGSPLNLQCAPSSGIVYTVATKSLDVTDGRVQAGNLTAIPLPASGSVTVVNQGTAGATTYTYSLQACLADGTCNAAGPASTTTTGNATLSATDFNRLTWSGVPGSALYKIRRDVGGASTGVIWSGTALELDDTGLAGDSSAKPTVDGTGVVTAGRVLVGVGSAAAPSVAVGISGTGVYASDVNHLSFSVGGALVAQLRAGPIMKLQSDTALVQLGTGLDTILSRGAAATLQLGSTSSATPIGQTLQAQGGAGTDIGGAHLTIQSGAGTGAGAVSSLVFKTPSATTTGTTTQTQAARMTLDATGPSFSGNIYPYATDQSALGLNYRLLAAAYLSRATLGSKSKAITDGGATAFATFTIADGATYGGKILYSVVSTQGTARQRLDGEARFSATREGTTYTVAVNEIGTQTLAAAAGTLTGAIEISGTAGVITLSANFNTSQTPDTFVINVRFNSTDAALALLFP